MKHPNTTIKLKTESGFTTIFRERVYTWKRYKEVLRRYREVMDESVANLFVKVEG